MPTPEQPDNKFEALYSDATYEAAYKFLNDGYIDTTEQFNIGRVQGIFERGLDLVHPETSERVYVTDSQGSEIDTKLRAELGESIIFPVKESAGEVTVYQVPADTRPLIQTIKSAPYEKQYMQSLASRAIRMMAQVRAVSPGLKIGLENIAVTSGKESDDDIALVVIPPFDQDINYQSLSNPERYVNPHLIKALGHLAIRKTLQDSLAVNPALSLTASDILKNLNFPAGYIKEILTKSNLNEITDLSGEALPDQNIQYNRFQDLTKVVPTNTKTPMEKLVGLGLINSNTADYDLLVNLFRQDPEA